MADITQLGSFEIPETIPLRIKIFGNDEDDLATLGKLVDPDTSIEVRILDDDNAEVLAFTAMTKISVGIYRFDFDSTGKAPGRYQARFKTVDATKVSQQDAEMKLVA